MQVVIGIALVLAAASVAGAGPLDTPGAMKALNCSACHGPDGRGDRAKLIPDLAGQPPGYLKNQMMLFREDKRSPGDPSLKAIKELMKSLSDDTMSDLAAYYSSVR